MFPEEVVPYLDAMKAKELLDSLDVSVNGLRHERCLVAVPQGERPTNKPVEGLVNVQVVRLQLANHTAQVRPQAFFGELLKPQDALHVSVHAALGLRAPVYPFLEAFDVEFGLADSVNSYRKYWSAAMAGSKSAGGWDIDHV